MSSQLRVKETGGSVQDASLYDEDFAEWVERQVELLRSGPAAALDLPHLIEELEGLTKRDERALGSQLKRIMAHLLKQRHQPQRATRSWADSIANGREEVADILGAKPEPAPHPAKPDDQELPRAASQAAPDTRLPIDTFPAQPPFSLAAILGEAS